MVDQIAREAEQTPCNRQCAFAARKVVAGCQVEHFKFGCFGRRCKVEHEIDLWQAQRSSRCKPCKLKGHAIAQQFYPGELGQSVGECALAMFDLLSVGTGQLYGRIAARVVADRNIRPASGEFPDRMAVGSVPRFEQEKQPVGTSKTYISYRKTPLRFL